MSSDISSIDYEDSCIDVNVTLQEGIDWNEADESERWEMYERAWEAYEVQEKEKEEEWNDVMNAICSEEKQTILIEIEKTESKDEETEDAS